MKQQRRTFVEKSQRTRRDSVGKRKSPGRQFAVSSVLGVWPRLAREKPGES